jgi:hypothetical protein
VYDGHAGHVANSAAEPFGLHISKRTNLVINRDANQIIVATVHTQAAGALPPITYTSGGLLEDAEIRKAVCGILEGGARAIKEQARRLRVRLQR